MNILVTGGAGYIGSHTAKILLLARHQVVIYDNLSTGLKDAIPEGAQFVEGDVRDLEKLVATIENHKIEAVVHFAAKLVVPESITQPLEYYENNTSGVINLAKACRSTGVRYVVFSSTAAVYGDANTDTAMVNENSIVAPLNPYGWSKYMSEQILKDCESAFGLKSVCLRYFNVAGGAEDGKNGQRTKNATHLIKVASEAACGKRESIGIFGVDYPTYDGTGVRDYIHVEDLGDLHRLALDYLAAGGTTNVFNCGYGHGFSVKDVVATVKKVSGQDFKVNTEPRRPGDAASLVADSTKVRTAFAWAPKRDNLDLICKTAYQWEKRQ